jgi:hypothetical protein
MLLPSVRFWRCEGDNKILMDKFYVTLTRLSGDIKCRSDAPSQHHAGRAQEDIRDQEVGFPQWELFDPVALSGSVTCSYLYGFTV